MSSLYILDIKHLSDIWFPFFHSISCYFILYIYIYIFFFSFAAQKLFNSPTRLSLLLLPLLLESNPKHHHQANVQVLLSMLPPRSFIVSGITVQFSRSVVFDSLWSHGLLHTRLPYPSLTPGACSNSCPSSWWCHLTISSSVIPFSSQISHSSP